MAILGCRMSQSCSSSSTTSVISITDSSDTPLVKMGGNTGDHGDSMEWTENWEWYFLEIITEMVKRDPNGSKRRKNKISTKDKLDKLKDQWSEYMIARKEMDLAKAEKYKAHPLEVTRMTDEFSIDSCMSILNNLPNITDNSYIKALDRFMDADWRKMFLLMPKDRRNGWLDSLDN